MGAEQPSAQKAVELDECIDRLLATGRWAVGTAPGKAHAETDSLMHVAALLLALTRLITRPRPGQRDRVQALVPNSPPLRRAISARHQGSCTRPHFGSA